MAERKSFLVYFDSLTMLRRMSDEKRGKFFLAMVEYANNKTEPSFDDDSLWFAWDLVQANLDRDYTKWEGMCERNRNNGKLGGKPKQTQSNPVGSSGVQSNPQGADTETDKDRDTGIDTNKDTNPINKYTDEFETFWKLYPKKENKGTAFKAFKKAIKTANAETILTSVQRQLVDPMSCLRKDRQFIPHGSSWLNGERWHDETNKLTDEFFMGVAAAWNNHFSEFQYVKTMTDDRKNAIQKIVDNFPKRDMTDVEQWERFFIYIIEDQNWFLGNNQLGIKGSFDKLLDGDMFFKIAEKVKVWR